MSIRIRQEATHRGEGWWDWSVWLDGPAGELDTVEKVVYHLHPTFLNPLQAVQDRSTGFRLDALGWGGFTLHADVHYRNDRTERLSHELELPEEEEMARGGEGEEPRQLTVYLSFSIADTKAAQNLRSALESEGLRVKSALEMPVSEQLETHVKKEIGTSDACISIFSDTPSALVEEDVNYAVLAEVPVVPVILGKAADMPTALKRQAIRISKEGDLDRAAQKILDALGLTQPSTPVQKGSSPRKKPPARKPARSRKKTTPQG